MINVLKHTILFIFIFISLSCKSKRQLVLDNSSYVKQIHVKAFGAIPNDNINDSDAIQSAFDRSKEAGISLIIFEPGIYKLSESVIAGSQNASGEFLYTTMHIKGHIPAFSTNQSIGATTVFQYTGDGAALIVQSGLSCVIENIAFTGSGPILSDPLQISHSTSETWRSNGLSTEHFSPHCAVAIDPFHHNVPVPSRYKKLDKYYTNKLNGGSSMISIKGCSFSGFYIAIANNPSNGVANGENIRAEFCHVANCHTFWSSGQTQSRGNTINNIYALYMHTFIQSNQIGKKEGTPPIVSNVTIGGFCKYLLNVSTHFSGLSINQSFFESIWSLGIGMTNSVSFSNCQIQFRLPDSVLYAPPFHLYSHGVVEFSNCGIEYFNNCLTPAPIMLRAGALSVSGGWVEGGIIAADGITNYGGERLNNIKYNNVLLKCQGGFVGQSTYQRPIENLSNQPFTGKEILSSERNGYFLNTGNTYNIIDLGSITLKVDDKTKTGSFQYINNGLLKQGDNLFIDKTVPVKAEQALPYTIRPSLGYVKETSGNTVLIENISEGINSGNYSIYLAETPRFIPPIWGDITTGSRIITNVISYSPSFYPKEGTRIFAEGIVPGTYITATDPFKNTITLSYPGTSTGAQISLRNADYVQELFIREWPGENIEVLKEGAIIHLEQPFLGGYFFTNKSKAISNTKFKAKLSEGTGSE